MEDETEHAADRIVAREAAWLEQYRVQQRQKRAKREAAETQVSVPRAYFQEYCQGDLTLEQGRAYTQGYINEQGIAHPAFWLSYRHSNRTCWFCACNAFAHKPCETCGAPWYDPTQRMWWQFWRGSCVTPEA